MYNPTEIVNFELLSSYLRTSSVSLDKFVNGSILIIDIRSKEGLISIKKNEKPDFIIERFYIPKKNKKLGYRIVYKLKNQFTIDILKVLKFNLDDLYIPADCVHGFVKNRNTLTNAKCHINKKYLLKLDIKNFFESINIESIKKAFMSLGFTEEIANNLSKICTLQGKLVQGYPTSPILANIVCSNLDKELSYYCNQVKATYTRYADDISITSDLEYPQIEIIVDILKKYGFKLNKLKSQKFKFGQNQYVTGLSIADEKYPRIPKSVKKRLRQQLHYLKLYGYHSHICYINNWDEKTDISVTSELSSKLRNYIKGWIDYINPIEPKVAKQLYDEFNIIDNIEKEKSMKNHEKLKQESGGIITLRIEDKYPILKNK